MRFSVHSLILQDPIYRHTHTHKKNNKSTLLFLPVSSWPNVKNKKKLFVSSVSEFVVCLILNSDSSLKNYLRKKREIFVNPFRHIFCWDQKKIRRLGWTRGSSCNKSRRKKIVWGSKISESSSFLELKKKL